MLGPFRIRNLRRSTSPPNRASYAAATRRGSLDTLVSIKGPEYDYTVLMNPESKLKYLDEDDGEMVTVGTSFELSQRLDEPVPKFQKARSDNKTALGNGDDSFNTSSSISQPTHVFEIDRRGDAVKIWEEIEERSRQLRASLASTSPVFSAIAFASASGTPTDQRITQQAHVTDLKFQTLHNGHETQSAATYPQRDDRQQNMDEFDGEENQLHQIEDEYTTLSSARHSTEEEHAEDDEIRATEDGLANLASHSRQLYQHERGPADCEQRLQEPSIPKREAGEVRKEEETLKELEAISSHENMNASHLTIPARLSLNGALADICLSPNCAMSLVDSAFLQKYLPGCPIMDMKPVQLRGIGETIHSSSQFAVFDLYIPCNGNKIAKMSRGARVVKNLTVQVLVGMDIMAPEGITIDLSNRLATIASCENLQVPLSINRNSQKGIGSLTQKIESFHGLDPHSYLNWPTSVEACRYCRRRKIRGHGAQTSSDGRCGRGFEKECEFISKHGQAWYPPQMHHEASGKLPYQSLYTPAPPHDPRLYYFTASNPPQLAHEKSEEADKPAHHTSMRLSDVLNDENEAKEVCEETAPLLESFSEGNLTAEGKRQAMEAGKRLRLRSNPAFQMAWTGGLRPQQTKTNRWAQYGSTEIGNMAATRSSSAAPVTELAQPASPLLVSPIANTQSVSETEGSLLQAFRTELSKISNPSKDIPLENEVTKENSCPCPEKSGIKKQPRSRANTSGPELEAFTRNLILQTIASIGSNVETLKAQLQHHVLDVIPEHMIRPRATPIKYHLRNACSDFKVSVDAAMEALAVEPSVEDNTTSPETLQLHPPLPTAIRSLQAMTYAFDTFSQRLRMIEDSKISLERNDRDLNVSPSTLGHVNIEEYGEHHASHTAIPSVAMERGSCEEDSNKAQISSSAPAIETREAPIQRGPIGPSVRFLDTQATRHESSKDDSITHNITGHRYEPSIAYRHVPTWSSLDPPRGRQSLQQPQMRTSVLLSKHSETALESELHYKRRSMPETERRRESRSRSRSPDACMAREMPAPRQTEGSLSQVQPRSWHHSNLPIRHHHLGWGAGRSILERQSTLIHDAMSSGYRPLPQQRSINRAAHVRFGTTSVHPPSDRSAPHALQYQTTEDRNRLVAAASLRHSKSLNAIRKPPAPLCFTARKDVDMKPELSSTMRKPFDDPKKAEMYALASPATENEAMSYPLPISPLVATRFPTLEQFEDSNRSRAPQFPPLPSMEPLIPVRVNADRMEVEAHASKSRVTDPVEPRADQKLAAYQKERAQQQKAENESSGDFFRRMTGLEAPSERRTETTRFSSGPLGARLVKPFDPLAETATIHRHQLIDGVRRSATVGGLHDRYAAANRRPYSAYFDGNGRVEWDSFLEGHRNARAQDEEKKQFLGPKADLYRHDRASMRNLPHKEIIAQQTEGSPSTVVGRTSRVPASSIAREEASTPLHHDASTVSSVQWCVDQLKDLGFGKEEDGGARRLVVYAQAANGNLEDAMDMIDEERKAYEERS
ncbi:hypothetical protein MMC11_008815 [Xylographa trunciseda]|nr:hypothetical protein [Xylographa trunciseda]